MTDAFPFPPNRRGRPYTIRRSFRTEIIQSRGGREQRIARRARPRWEIEYPITVTDDCRRSFERVMAGAQRQAVYIHERPRYVTLASGATAANATVSLGQEAPGWLAEGSVVMLVHKARLAAFTVDTLNTGDTVTFTEAPSEDWPAGTRLHPALKCRLNADLSGSRVSPRGVIDVTIRADVEPGTRPEESAGTAENSFEGYEVFLRKPDKWEPVSLSFMQDRDRVDYGFGRFRDFHPVAFAHLIWQAQYTACSASDAESLRAFTRRTVGMRGEFFMPTFQQDLVLSASASSGAGTLTVEGENIATDYGDDPVHKVVAILLPSGEYEFARITAMTALTGDETQLTLADTLSADVPLGSRISWMPLRRLASDDIQEDWHPEKDIARLTLSMRTLEYLESEIPPVEWAKVAESTFTIAAGSGSETKALPGTLQDGDIVLIFRASDRALDAASSDILTDGYEEPFEASDFYAVGGDIHYKLLSGSPIDSEVEIEQRNTVMQAGIIQIWRTADATTPIDATVVHQGAEEGLPDCPAYTPANPGNLVFAVGFIVDEDIAGDVGAMEGFTNFLAADTGQASDSVGATVMVASKTNTADNIVTPGAFQFTTSPEPELSSSQAGVTFGLRWGG